MSISVSNLLQNRVALVTGAGRGLGRAIVGKMAAAGARGVAIEIDSALLESEFPEGWFGFEGDVRDESSVALAVKTVVDRFGRLDVAVPNAGLVPLWRSVEDIDLTEWDNVFAVNVRGVAATIKHAARVMKDAGGSIVATASTSAFRSRRGQAIYTASKHAVLGIVRAAAQDLGRYGIRVNALAPGPVATEAARERMQRRAPITGLSEGQALEAYASETALGRIATVDDVASTALYLASDLSSGVTGTLAPVECGWA